MQSTIEENVAELLWSSGASLCTAESCTGGLIAHRLTNIPGSSRYMKGGVIAYTAAAKVNLLHVRADTLRRFGEVSSQTASEMACGARKVFEADYALSTTGIAGPAGGSAKKPVGLTYIAMAGPHNLIRVQRQTWDGDRTWNKERSADAALALLLHHLKSGDEGD